MCLYVLANGKGAPGAPRVEGNTSLLVDESPHRLDSSAAKAQESFRLAWLEIEGKEVRRVHPVDRGDEALQHPQKLGSRWGRC